jgi:hypothetical protein
VLAVGWLCLHHPSLPATMIKEEKLENVGASNWMHLFHINVGSTI